MNRQRIAGALFAVAGLLSLVRIALQPTSAGLWAVAVGVGSLVLAGLFAFGDHTENLSTDRDGDRAGLRTAAVVAAVACFLGGAGYALVS